VAPSAAPHGEQLKSKPKPDKTSAAAAPATVIVSLPSEAKLSIDGAPTASASERRVFTSPALEPGKAYHYSLAGVLVRDGQTITATKLIEVRAGEETKVSLDFSQVTVAQR
jgi:uncharacterized protein (TIGR03000 family)